MSQALSSCQSGDVSRLVSYSCVALAAITAISALILFMQTRQLTAASAALFISSSVLTACAIGSFVCACKDSKKVESGKESAPKPTRRGASSTQQQQAVIIPAHTVTLSPEETFIKKLRNLPNLVPGDVNTDTALRKLVGQAVQFPKQKDTLMALFSAMLRYRARDGLEQFFYTIRPFASGPSHFPPADYFVFKHFHRRKRTGGKIYPAEIEFILSYASRMTCLKDRNPQEAEGFQGSCGKDLARSDLENLINLVIKPTNTSEYSEHLKQALLLFKASSEKPQNELKKLAETYCKPLLLALQSQNLLSQ